MTAMHPNVVLETSRLTMRPWRVDDQDAFYALNIEPEVQKFLSPLTRAGSDQLLERIGEQFAERGWGFWALQERDSGSLIGMCGIAPLTWEAPFGPAVELSWRLSQAWQGKGYAREAAEASVHFGLKLLKLDRLVAFTAPANTASWGLMERLGMQKIGNFDYPSLPKEHPLTTQVLYEIRL